VHIRTNAILIFSIKVLASLNHHLQSNIRAKKINKKERARSHPMQATKVIEFQTTLLRDQASATTWYEICRCVEQRDRQKDASYCSNLKQRILALSFC
jgi:hypothetical protein